MKKNKRIGLVIFSAVIVFIFIGNCGFGKLLEEDPELNLKSLKIHGENVEKTVLVIYKEVTEITSDDISAFFSYDYVEEPVELQVEVKNSPVFLSKETPTPIELYVSSKTNEYKSWSKSITVIVKP